VAVQQSDVTANKNVASTITTAQTLSGINAQIQQNLKDLPTAVKANQQAATEPDQGVEAADLLLNTDSAAAATAGAASAAATGAATNTGKKGSNTGKASGNTAKAGVNAVKGNKNARAFMA
jgi:hypothetical protein